MNLVSETQLARRMAILSTARRMLVEKGFDAITVRDLAEACRVSVPTLYNQFGGKDQLLVAAIETHFVDGSDEVPVIESEPGMARLLAIIDVAARRLLESPEENRRILHAFSSLESSLQVQQRIGQRMVEYFNHELEVMRGGKQLSGWVEIPMLAGQVTTAFISAATIWGSGAVNDDKLIPMARYSAGLILFGVVTGKSKKLLEPMLIEAQQLMAGAIDLPKTNSQPN